MNSKLAIFYDEIRRGFSAGDPNRSRATRKPDFKVESFDEGPSLFGRSSLCQDGGTTFNYRDEQG
jgi:hypothetical protein